MSSDAQRQTSLRSLILKRISALVAVATLLVAGAGIWFGLLPLVDKIALGQFTSVSANVESDLRGVFSPATQLLGMSRGWLAGEAPDLQSPAAFNRLFQPLLENSKQITSVVAGTSNGQGWLLLHQGDGSWRNRMTDVEHWGDQRHRLIDRLPDGTTTQRWDDHRYDPRQREWYRVASAAATAGEVQWTPPYRFFTTGDVGITASTALALRDGRSLVLGFDLMLRDLSQSTQNAVVGNTGLALVLTQDERVLALPKAAVGVAQTAWLGHLLKPAAELGLAPVNAALTRWHSANGAAQTVISFTSAGTRWLANVRPYALGQQQLLVLTLAPAADFEPAWWPLLGAFGVALVLVLGLAMLVTRLAAERLVRPLGALAAVNAQIGRLDFQPPAHVQSAIVEIGQLEAAQDAMLALLQKNQHSMAAQAQELRLQIDALQETKAELNRQNDMLAAIIENFPGGISVCDASLRVRACNEQFKNLLSLPASLFQNPQIYFEDIIRFNAQRGDYGAGEVEDQVRGRVARALEFKAHKIERVLPNGTVLEVRGTPLPGGGFVTLYTDITERSEHQQKLEFLAHFDALTALPNRMLLSDRLNQSMIRVHRSAQQLAVVYLDLDGFKAINDSHGHEVGDLLLMALATRMKQTLREGDTLARIGGDEFVAVLPDLSDSDACTPLLMRLLEAAAQPVPIEGLSLHVSASMGVTFYAPGDQLDSDLLLRQADQAMYIAKQSGKSRFQFFDTAQERNLRVHYEKVEQIRLALTHHELVLYYQPKVNMRSSKVVGVEALIRWQHPQQGLLAPLAFLPAIEDHPLAIEVGEWVIASALGQIESWHVAGLDIPVSVNVGARQLLQTDFVARLKALLKAHPGADPMLLQVEVLETSALEDLSHVARVIAECRVFGVTFAMDDFGTGYSSLTYLKKLQVDLLKIDQSFVRDMLDNAEDLAILQGVIGLANAFHREVIAEGVETSAHGSLLLQLGCELAQGFGIARPMPSESIVPWIQAWQRQPVWLDNGQSDLSA